MQFNIILGSSSRLFMAIKDSFTTLIKCYKVLIKIKNFLNILHSRLKQITKSKNSHELELDIYVMTKTYLNTHTQILPKRVLPYDSVYYINIIKIIKVNLYY
jgi:hypothetical protein